MVVCHEIIWEAPCISGHILSRVRIIQINDEEFIMEIVNPKGSSLWERIKLAFNMIVYGHSVNLGVIVLDKEEVKKLSGLET